MVAAEFPATARDLDSRSLFVVHQRRAASQPSGALYWNPRQEITILRSPAWEMSGVRAAASKFRLPRVKKKEKEGEREAESNWVGVIIGLMD